MAILSGKVALVTGGTSGIGRETVIALGENGAKVVFSGRREAEGNETLKLLQAAGGTGLFVQSDVSKASEIEKLVQTVVDRFGKLDIAFNNAGVEGDLAPLHEATEENYDFIFDINVKGLLMSMKYEIAQMLKQGHGGSIINTSSIAGEIGFAGAAIYAASKHAVSGLTKSAALEYGKQKIRVNAVAPAAIQSEMLDRFTGGPDSEMRKYMTNLHPIGRIGQPREVAEAVVWLASDLSSFVTGHNLPVDGGFLAQ